MSLANELARAGKTRLDQATNPSAHPQMHDSYKVRTVDTHDKPLPPSSHDIHFGKESKGGRVSPNKEGNTGVDGFGVTGFLESVKQKVGLGDDAELEVDKQKPPEKS